MNLNSTIVTKTGVAPAVIAAGALIQTDINAGQVFLIKTLEGPVLESLQAFLLDNAGGLIVEKFVAGNTVL